MVTNNGFGGDIEIIIQNLLQDKISHNGYPLWLMDRLNGIIYLLMKQSAAFMQDGSKCKRSCRSRNRPIEYKCNIKSVS